VGTTTIAVGFSAEQNWKYKIAESLVRNFFAAIHRDELWFFVDDRSIEIDKGALGSILQMPEIEQAAATHGASEELRFSKTLYECLIDGATKRFDTKIRGLGNFAMHILVKEGLPKRVAIIRNGMLITDNLGNFGDKLAHFPMYKDFVAIVEPEDIESKALFKRLENPRHDELSAERLETEQEKRAIRSAFGVLCRWIRDSIKSEALVPPAEEIVLEEMNEFFGDLGKSDAIPDPTEGEPDPLTVKHSPIKKRRKPEDAGSTDDEEGEGGGGGSNDSKGGDRTGKGKGKGDSSGGTGGGDVTLLDFRNVPNALDPLHRRTLFFTPMSDGTSKMSLYAKGMNDDVQIYGVVFRNSAGVAASTIELVAGVRTRIEVELASSYVGPISLKLTKSNEGGADETQ
jgi:hypothetical protein